jgi:hypothetical protein
MRTNVPTLTISRVQTNGFALLLALIIASVALSIGLTLLSVTIKQLDLNATSRESEMSFRVAAAGIECLSLVRYDINNEPDDDSYTCMGVSDFQLTETVSGNPSVYTWQGDWAVDGSDRCADLSLYVYEGHSSDVTITLNDTIGNRTLESDICAADTTCMVALARGYSRSCSDAQNPSVFTVEREITAEL